MGRTLSKSSGVGSPEARASCSNVTHMWRGEESLTRRCTPKPFIRWVGGKRFLAGRITAAAPTSFGKYFEPFLGSGAVFFQLEPSASILGDLNPDLICAYEVVRDSVEDVVDWLEEHSTQDADAYYFMRSMRPTTAVARAGRFLFLNRTAFNGVWRVNRQGEYNVPYGYRRREDLVGADGLRAASVALSKAQLVCDDFETTLASASEGDLVYVDPPYTVRHNSNGFRKYNETLFSWKDQIRLAEVLNGLAINRCHVIVSNASNADVLALYPRSLYQRQMVTRKSLIAGTASSRATCEEVLLVSEGSHA